jgi:LuxR family transcriptional regulator, activator of conjugal transfer of Ti plasmids
MKNLLLEFEQHLMCCSSKQAELFLSENLAKFTIKAFAFTFYTRHPNSANKVKYNFASPPIKLWHKHYLEQHYSDNDMTADEVHTSILPVYWDINDQLKVAKNDIGKQLRLEAIELGIQSGLCFPLFGPQHEYASGVIYQRTGETFLNNIEPSKYTLMALFQIFFNYIIKHSHEVADNTSQQILTQREYQCLTLSSQSFTSEGIAKKLKITKRTVDFHMKNVNNKLGVNSRYQAVNEAILQGLIES